MEKYILYGGAVELNYNPFRHLYYVGDEIVYGVTNATSVIDKSGGLLPWAVNTAVSYVKENIKPGVSYDEMQLLDIFETAARQHSLFKQKAADAGTIVHQWIHDYICGRSTSMPVNPALVNAVNSFLEWEKTHDVKITLSEQKIYSKEYKYAGTLDAEGHVNGKLSIIDFKTSKGIYDEMRFQVAAYQQARQEETGNSYHSRWIIRFGKEVKPDGTLDFEAVELHDFDKDIKAFLGALEIRKRLMELKSGKIKKHE